MSIAGNIKKNILKKSRFQDLIFISGILVFTASLVLGLFPETGIIEGAKREYFVYLIMIIPILAAIYFIFISFSRKIYSNHSNFSSSFVFKMMLAFISVAILPSLTIIIISNHIINETISNLITEKTVYALNESVKQSNEYIQSFYNDINGELNFLDFTLKKSMVNLDSGDHRELLVKNYKYKDLYCIIYRVYKKSPDYNTIKILNNDYKKEAAISQYYRYSDLDSILRISSISISKQPVLVGYLYNKNYIVAILKEVPERINNRIAIYNDSLNRYNKGAFLKPYFQTEIGILLLSIAVLIILISISVSFFLSRSFTRPMLELAEATGHVASGDFRISLKRDSSDELAVLFKSFNKMVKDLDESKKILYHAQRLEAWREVARRIVHEIKNPLTPIRLSAERIQNRYREGHPDIDNIVISGTETIIEEAKVLNRILEEFSGFARLPEMHGEFLNINPVIENSVNFFLGHEGITFHTDLDSNMPKLFIDKILIRQALTNLMQNSIDAVENNGNIHIKSVFDINNPGYVTISIRDDGPGVEENNLDKIFDPTFSTKDTGTGLGLAIVEKIVLEHNGRIFFYSKIGEGAEFVIELPVLEEEPFGKNTGS